MAARKSVRSATAGRNMGTASEAAPARRASSGSSSPRSFSAEDAGGIAQWFSNPAVRYVASGIATAVLAKIATNLAGRYPQISQLLREGMESVEGKLSDFNGGSSMREDSEVETTQAAPTSRSRRSAAANMSTH